MRIINIIKESIKLVFNGEFPKYMIGDTVYVKSENDNSDPYYGIIQDINNKEKLCKVMSFNQKYGIVEEWLNFDLLTHSSISKSRKYKIESILDV